MLENLKSLETLYLNGNFIRSIPDTDSELWPFLEDLNLSDNQLMIMPEFIFKIKPLATAKLDNNQIKRWPDGCEL